MKHISEIIWISWLLSEILLNRIFRSEEKVTKKFDKFTLRSIWLTIVVSVFLGVFIKSSFKFPVADSVWLRYFGLGVIVIGMIIRFIAVKTLGKFFTVDLAIHHEHKLITNGIYKYIRHPSYTGTLTSFLGFALSLNNWLSLFIVFIPVLLAFIHRINTEEILLSEQIGQEYTDYIWKTKRLLPLIY
jgi:protein-S-isoprenylcysteine O-methyltransferase Ste14